MDMERENTDSGDIEVKMKDFTYLELEERSYE